MKTSFKDEEIEEHFDNTLSPYIVKYGAVLDNLVKGVEELKEDFKSKRDLALRCYCTPEDLEDAQVVEKLLGEIDSAVLLCKTTKLEYKYVQVLFKNKAKNKAKAILKMRTEFVSDTSKDPDEVVHSLLASRVAKLK